MSHAAATGSTTTRANYKSHPCRFSAVHPLRVRVVRRGGRNRGPGAASVPLILHSSMLDALRRVAGFAVCFLATTTRPQAVGRPSLFVPPSLALLRRPRHHCIDAQVTWLTRNTRLTHAAICPSPAAPRDPPPRTTDHTVFRRREPRSRRTSCSTTSRRVKRERERKGSGRDETVLSPRLSASCSAGGAPRRSPPLCVASSSR